MCENFPKLELSEPGQKYPHMPKISPGGLPVSSINSVHINIYTIQPRLSGMLGTRQKVRLIESSDNQISAYRVSTFKLNVIYMYIYSDTQIRNSFRK